MKKLSPVEQKASSKVLDELRKHAQSMMSDKVKGLKKVTVASDSSEGLKKGLSKAEEIIGKKPTSTDLGTPEEELDKQTVDGEEEEETPEHEASESPEMEQMEDEYHCETPEEVDAAIKKLMELKKEMLAKK